METFQLELFQVGSDMETNPCTRNSSLGTWLADKECQPLLRKAAVWVVKRAYQKSLSFRFFGLEDGDDLITSIANILWLYLKEKDEQGNCGELAELVAQRDYSKFASMLTLQFFDYCLDRRRSTTSYQSYYRRVREVLAKGGDDLQYRATKDSACYAYSSSPDLLHMDEGVLSAHDFKDWPHPDEPTSEIRKGASILKISRFFWDEAMKRVASESFLPIKELTRFVDDKYDLSDSVADNMSREEGREQRVEDEELVPSPELCVVQKQLAAFAERLVKSWDVSRRRIFYLRFMEEKGLKEIAEIFGYSSASAVEYQVRKILGAIKEAWTQWDLAGFGMEAHKEKDIFGDMIFYYVKADFATVNNSTNSKEESCS